MQTASAGPAYAGRVVTTWQEFAGALVALVERGTAGSG